MFRQLLEDLPVSFAASRITESGIARVTCEGRDIAVVMPDAEPDKVYFRTTVGSAADSDRDALVRALLRANALWQGTAGAVLSMKDDTVYLTDRREQDTFADSEALAGFLENFAATAVLWSERLAGFHERED